MSGPIKTVAPVEAPKRASSSGPTPAHRPPATGLATTARSLDNQAMQRMAREGASAHLKGPLISQSVASSATSVPSTATWLASLGLATTSMRDDIAQLASINAQLESLIITDEYRAELEKKRAEVELVAMLRKESAARVDLIGLEQEAQQREASAQTGTSSMTSGPTSVTVPLWTLFAIPEPYDEYMLYFQIVADPSSNEAVRLAGRYIIDQYLSKKLDWPVTIEIIQPEGHVWFEFSAQGQVLVDSKELKLPLTALDAVSPETLFEVSKRASLIVEAASFEAAAAEMAKTIGEKAEGMIKNPEDYARNEAVGLSQLTDSYVKRLGELVSACGTGQDWIRQRLSIRQREMVPVAERVKEMGKVTNDYHNKIVSDMPTYAGETYDRVVDESSNFVEEYGWRAWRFLGNAVTGGGQSTQAENARMYRAGEISRTDYKKNWGLNIVRVGATAVMTALTAGRATGPALRLLGLSSGSAAAAVTAGAAEGIVGGYSGAVTSDAFAVAVSLASDSPGVVAFHERTIGGPEGWLDSMGWGGAVGMGFALIGHYYGQFSAKTPNLPKLMAPRGKPGGELGAAPEQPDLIGIKIKDEPNGDFAFFAEDTVSGKRLLVQGNRLAGNATVVDPLTGELVGSMRGGVIDTPAGALPPAADPITAPTEPVFGPVDRPGQIGPASDVAPSAQIEEPFFSPSEVDESMESGFRGEGPMVRVPAHESGHPANVLEVGSGPERTFLGVPESPAVTLLRTDLERTFPIDRVLDATGRLDADLVGAFDTIIINNPRGYIPNLQELGRALRPGGRIIVQGNMGRNPEFRQLVNNVRTPLGFSREHDFIPQRDLPPEFSPRDPEAIRRNILGGPFRYTNMSEPGVASGTEGPGPRPNYRVIYTRVVDP